MTAAAEQGITSPLLHAAVRATFAPSVHNTQPWRFELHADQLDVFAEPSRQLRVLDPTRRQLMISCGCAVFNARVALAAGGLDPIVQRFPDATQPNLIARISATRRRTAGMDPIAAYDEVVELRQTNRRRFEDEDVPSEVISSLEFAAALEGAALVVLRTDEQRMTLARLAKHAAEVQRLDPACRAELRAWTPDDIGRLDGGPPLTVPHVDYPAGDQIPMRGFDTPGKGWLPAETSSSPRRSPLLLCTDQDTMSSWLTAGEALERVLLELTRRGYVASPLTQVIEVASARSALRRELGLAGYPDVLLRVGRAPLTPASRRRRLVDVLVQKH